MLAIGGYGSQPRDALRFFPLLPQVVHYLGLGGHAAGPILLIVTNVAALAYGVLFARLLRVEGVDPGTIVRAQWLLALAPPAFVLVMGYTEAVFGLLAVGMFLGLRTKRWPLAVACGLLAGLCRPVGVLLVLPALVEAWQARGSAAASPARAGGRSAGRARRSIWAGCGRGTATRCCRSGCSRRPAGTGRRPTRCTS